VLRPRTLLRSFYYMKNRTLTALSNFREFLKNKNSLGPLNLIFRIRSPKGIFGQNMSDLPNGSLTGLAFLDPNSQPFLSGELYVLNIICKKFICSRHAFVYCVYVRKQNKTKVQVLQYLS